MKPKILLLGLICGLALAAETGAELFQKAVVQERAAGNLDEAIKLYQRVAKEFASDRALAAKALVQAARCYEKLGQDKAVKLYEQVARDFGDQREPAGTARQRLAVISAAGRAKSSPGMVTRQIPALTTGRLKQSDGRHVFYISRDGLVVSGMDGSGAKVIATNPAGASVNAGLITNFVVSRDGKQVAFGLHLTGNKESIRVVGVDGSGSREVYDMSQLGERPMSSASGLRGRILDWSPDGSRILAAIDQADQTTSLISISASDGSARVLASGALLSPAKFSPDGKYVAYTVNGGGFSNPFLSPEMDIDIVAVDGSYSGKLVEHPGGDKILDWTPDGAYILFLSDRTGAPSIYALAVSQGRPQGDPILVKQDSGNMANASMARDGSLYYLGGSGSHDELFLASLDPVRGTLSANPKRIAERPRETQRGGSWSSDGSLFAYQAGSPEERSRHRLYIRAAESGREREFRLDGGVSGALCWAPDNATLYVVVPVGVGEQFSLHSVSATTGEDKQIVVYPRHRVLSSISLSHDRKALLMGFRDIEPMLKSLPPRAFVLRRDLATGEETELISKEAASEIAISPDGTRAAALDFQTGPAASVSLKPLNGGEWKRSATIAGRLRTDSLQWMPDSSSVVFSAFDTSSVLFTLSPEGGNPKKLAEFPEFAASVRAAIHPDGQQVLLRITVARSELWALENLLPNLATLTAKAKYGTGMVARQIPTPPGVLSQSDGKHLFYFSYAAGGLVAAGMDGLGAKVLFATTGIPGNGMLVLFPSISRDGSQVAFKLRRAVDTICVVGADGSGFREIYTFGARSFATLGGWSSDGRQLLAIIPEPDGTNSSLVSISVADGSTRKLVKGGLPNPRTSNFVPWAQFSPDGKYVAYSTGRGTTGGLEGPQPRPAVYVVAADGSSSSQVLDRSSASALLDWAPDGRHVLFVSDRSGTPAIYALAVAEGKPQGDPIIIKQDAGWNILGYVRKDGTMFYTVFTPRLELFQVDLDPARGSMAGAPQRISERPAEFPANGAWSPDGRQLAYSLLSPTARDRHKVVIRNLASGEDRELIVQGGGIPGPLCWSPDGGSIFETASLGGRWVMQSVSAATGAAKQVAVFDVPPHSISRTRDGKALLLGLHDTKRLRPSVIRHDLETGEETELVSKDLAFRLTVSPDGSRVAAVDTAQGGIMSLSVKPLNGGEWTRIATIGARDGDYLQWTPDGASLRFLGYAGETPVLWGIPPEGGKVEKLAEFPGWINAYAVVMRPDGQQALLNTSVARPELWSLENFLPKLQAAR